MPLTAGQTTLGTIKTIARQRADMENSNFIKDTELTAYVNLSYLELYDLLVTKYGNEYFVQLPFQIHTDGITESYALPDDFYKLLGVDLWLSNSKDSRITISPFMFRERNKFAVPNFQSFYGITNMRYRLMGNNIKFAPIPSANQTIELWYVPRATSLTSDADIVDGVNGWEEYIIIDTAIKMMQKEESDVTVLVMQKDAMLKRIEAAAEARDQGAAQTVSDVQRADFWYPSGNGSAGGGY